MTLVATGQISIGNISSELGLSATSTRSLNDSDGRTLAGVASGAISLSSFYGKSNGFAFNQTISANTANYNLKAAAIAAGWNQTNKLIATVTINAGVYVYATDGNTAFSTGVTFPATSTLAVINNGTILGYGGHNTYYLDINYEPQYDGTNGTAGGPAMLFQYATAVTNNGRIAGGGGGGGGGGSVVLYNYNTGIGGAGGNGVGMGGSNSLTSPTAGQEQSGGGNDGETVCQGGEGGTGGSYGAAGAAGGQAASYGYSIDTLVYAGSGGAGGIATNTRASTGSTITGGTINGSNT